MLIDGEPSTITTPRRVIAHCDIDAFYASVELQRRPELAGVPLIVGGLGPRSVVTTASYEARAFGVQSAMPMSRARRLCPGATVIEPDMTAYRAASRAVWNIAAARFAQLQQVGIDEAYVDVTDEPQPLAALRALVADVRAQTGLTLSVGVGPSRLVAKVSSGAVKPSGFGVLSREQACEHFAGQSVRLLQGIGPRTAERLAEIGITTVGALQQAAPDALSATFGGDGAARLLALANFHDSSPVNTVREIKSCSRETTFPEDLTEPAQVRAAILALADRLAEDLARRALAGRTIGIKVRRADWSTITRAHTLTEPTNAAADLREIATALFDAEGIADPVRLVGVRCAGFDASKRPSRASRAGSAQLSLPL